MDSQDYIVAHAHMPTTKHSNSVRGKIEYEADGVTIIRVLPSEPAKMLHFAKPHGLGEHPSLWKATADHNRITSEQTELGLKYDLAMKRAAAWSAKPVPANDNQAWPLLQVLRKEGNDELVPVAERYRATHDRAMQEPLAGTWHDDLYVVPKHASKTDPDGRTQGAKVTVHLAGNMSGGHVVRECSKMAEYRRTNGINNPPRRSISKAKEWHGEDNVAAVLDARSELARYQAALGPLRETFEDAVLHSATLTEIGESMGAALKTGGAVGKALVMLGLEVVQEEMGILRRTRHRAA